MPGRGELTDAAWAVLAPLLPQNGKRGQQWLDHRRVINGILWKLRTGAPWRDVPERYGPWQTCYDRLVRWRRDGTWDRLLQHVKRKALRWARSSGRCVSTARRCGRISTRQGRASDSPSGIKKRGTGAAPAGRPRPQSGRVDDQNPSGVRWQGATVGDRGDARAVGRQPATGAGAERHLCAEAGGQRARAPAPCSAVGRQGL